MSARLEILSPNRSNISFELAPISMRFLAFLIDSVLLLICSWIFSAIFINSQSLALIVISLLFCYTFILETLTGGQTLGKFLLRIRVIKSDGSQPNVNDYFLRWSLRLVDYVMTISALGWGLMASSRLNQRLGDVYADTVVIYDRTKQDNRFSALNELHRKSSEVELNISNVERIHENDILLAKQLINYQTIYKGPVLESKIDYLVQHFVLILDMDMPENNRAFLADLINQYIFKTRS